MSFMTDDHDFMAWFMKNYRPHPQKTGWYIDKVCKGSEATIEGARSLYDIIQEVMKTEPFKTTDDGK